MTSRAPMTFTTLTQHERFWLDIITIATNNTNPVPTLERAQQLRRIFSSDAAPVASSPELTHGR